MSIIAKDKGGSDFEPVPAGNHHAICYAVYDIGTQQSFDPRFAPKRQVVFTWELPALRIDIERDGKKVNLPRAISRTFTLSLASKSNLRPFLNSWRGRAFTPQELEGFDVSKVAGANALLNIIHETKDGKTYANVSSISPIVTGMVKRQPENPIRVFTLNDFKGSVENLGDMPDWVKAKIMQSDEWIKMQQGVGHEPPHQHEQEGPDNDEDVPF